jgi:magnesium and cobalt exporter, CNNM family
VTYALTMSALIAGLIVINGIYVAAEFAIIACSKTKLTMMADEGSQKARQVLEIRREPARMNRYIATAQVGITLASLGLGMIGEPAIAKGMAKFVGEEVAHSPWMAIFAILLLTYPHVVIGEMVPKALALTKPTDMALVLRVFMKLSRFVFRPLVWFLDTVGNSLLKLAGIPQADESRRLFSPDELEMVVNQARAGGLVAGSEELMVENIFDLSERVAADIMTPRVKVDGISRDATLAEAFESFREHRYSRLPVYNETIDNIVGLLYSKDLARHYASKGDSGELAELIRKPRLIPRSMPVEDILALFRSERIQMMVVLDEFGGTAGLVTFEDLVEEVVGEIQDEFDMEENPIEEIGDGLLRVQGELLIEELAQHLKRPLSHPNVKTVGGLILDAVHDEPHTGDSTIWNKIEFRASAVTERHIDFVEVRLLPDLEQEEDGSKQVGGGGDL